MPNAQFLKRAIFFRSLIVSCTEIVSLINVKNIFPLFSKWYSITGILRYTKERKLFLKINLGRIW